MKSLLIIFLQFLARIILRKYNPKIVAVTGTIGKTSTKEAIFSVLQKHFDVWCNPGNYNNEIGVPLAIIGGQAGGRSPWKWFCVFFRALYLIIGPYRYPKVLILEMAADHPGDIKKLVQLAPPAIGVVTAVSPVHLEFFKTIEKLANEKSKLIETLPPSGTAILNGDDELVSKMTKKTKAQSLTYGFGDPDAVIGIPTLRRDGVDIQAIEMIEHLESGVVATGDVLGGVKFKIRHAGSVVPIFIPNVLGKQQVYVALAAAAVGLSLGLNLVEIAEGLRRYAAPRGRMKLLAGIKNTLLIDDTYNSSPRAAQEALEVLRRLGGREEKQRRIAILGDMLELGEYTEKAHQELGRACFGAVDFVAAVGERARLIAKEAVQAGIPQENVKHFHNTEEAGHFLQDEIRQGDILLIKGSQGMRMERIVKELMAEPLRAGELLVRQNKEWMQ